MEMYWEAFKIFLFDLYRIIIVSKLALLASHVSEASEK